MSRGPRLVLLGAALAVSMLAAPASAADWDDCVKQSGDPAIAACTRVIDSGIYSGRTLAQAYNNRGVEWTAKGDLARGLADFDEAVRHDPRQAAAFTNRGLAYAAKGDFDRAFSDYDQAIERDPKSAAAHDNRGLAYIKKGEPRRAISTMTRRSTSPTRRASITAATPMRALAS